MSGFIAVHVGAGSHVERLRPQQKKTCREACQAAMQLLKEGSTAVEAVACAVSVLENSPLTNAGIGSSLSLTGTVECDAGIMDGKTLNFASVGGIKNIQNPVLVCKKLLQVQEKGLLSGGRIPPLTLVGSGATDWATKHGFQLIKDGDLETEETKRSYYANMAKIDKLESNNILNSDNKLDTVGAVCMDSYGNVSSAASSGGLLLKYPGRVGQAAVYGAGCWAENSDEPDRPSIACCVTGAGEYLIKTMFSKECHRYMYENSSSATSLSDCFKKCYLDSKHLRNISLKVGGVLCVKHFKSEKTCELSWVHNSKTLILGYMGGAEEKPSTVVCMPTKENASGIVVGGEVCVRFKS